MIRHFPSRRPRQPKQSGAAMLIAIFALLLISVVAIALVVSSGTDSSLAGNYRTASSAYYAAVAGLEEARGRLLWKNPDCLVNRPVPPNCPNTGFIPMDPANGVVPKMSLTQVRYILNPNPLNGETVDPTNPTNPYADNEYQNELGFSLSGAEVQTVASDSPAAGLPGPAYKWVRINPVTENALGVDVNGDGTLDRLTPLVYDPAPTSQLTCPPANPGLFVPGSVPNCTTWSSNTAVQALEITALAVAPNGGKRLLQYVVAPLIISPDVADQNFPAALTLDGNGVTFDPPPAGTSYQINGQNGPSCPPAAQGAVYSVGFINPGDSTSISTAMTPATNYSGLPVPPSASSCGGSLGNLNLGYPNSLLRQSWLTPASLDAAMQDIENSADVVLSGNVTSSGIQIAAPAMSAANPMTIVINGNLRLNGNGFVGFGLLLVTGTLTYDSDTTWNGIVLVVGQGQFAASSFGSGNGGINGTVFVAQTRDSSGNLLPGNNLGSACFGPGSSCSGGGFGGGHHHGFGGGWPNNPGFGVIYNSAWVAIAHGPLSYKILSFHEIPLPN